LRTGVVDEPLRVLDQCRTTPAIVQALDGDTVRVLAQPLVWDGSALRLGALRPRAVRWRSDGLAFVSTLRPGQLVSLHWDFVCDVLSPSGALALEHANRRALASVNRSAATAATLV
jgi:hypothetical protein